MNNRNRPCRVHFDKHAPFFSVTVLATGFGDLIDDHLSARLASAMHHDEVAGSSEATTRPMPSVAPVITAIFDFLADITPVPVSSTLPAS